MDKVGIKHVDRIILAGAFGSHIDPKYALILGMLPDCEVSNISSAGNAAGTGALKALTNHNARTLIEQKILEVEKIETAVEKDFQHYFVTAMGIPNSEDPYEMLAKTITLPRGNKDNEDRINDSDPNARPNRRRRRS